MMDSPVEYSDISEDDTTDIVEYNEELRDDFKEFGKAYIELQRGGIFEQQDRTEMKKLESKLKSKSKTLSKQAAKIKVSNDGSFGMKITDDNLISACILTNLERVSDDVKVMIEDFYDDFRGEFDRVYSEKAVLMEENKKEVKKLEKKLETVENKLDKMMRMNHDCCRMLCAVVHRLNKNKDKENMDPTQPKITAVLGKRVREEEVRK